VNGRVEKRKVGRIRKVKELKEKAGVARRQQTRQQEPDSKTGMRKTQDSKVETKQRKKKRRRKRGMPERGVIGKKREL